MPLGFRSEFQRAAHRSFEKSPNKRVGRPHVARPQRRKKIIAIFFFVSGASPRGGDPRPRLGSFQNLGAQFGPKLIAIRCPDGFPGGFKLRPNSVLVPGRVCGWFLTSPEQCFGARTGFRVVFNFARTLFWCPDGFPGGFKLRPN